jgi:hypothetical protein
MKKYSLWLIILFFAGCHEHTSQESKPSVSRTLNVTTLRLADSLGTLKIGVPYKNDTFFTWINHSDCGKPCDKQMYRYQSKTMPVQEESGFFPPMLLMDSVDEITISHESWLHFLRTDPGISLGRHKDLEDHSKIQSGNMSLVRDTLFAVDGRNFSVYELERSDSVYGREVFATTSVRGVEIEFDFKFASRTKAIDEVIFFRDVMDIIRTIRVEPVPAKGNTR